MVYLDTILDTNAFLKHCPATGMQNSEEALLSISPATRAQLKVNHLVFFDQILLSYTF